VESRQQVAVAGLQVGDELLDLEGVFSLEQRGALSGPSAGRQVNIAQGRRRLKAVCSSGACRTAL
jgi:hypothetical protein